jgi:hypothetical protein
MKGNIRKGMRAHGAQASSQKGSLGRGGYTLIELLVSLGVLMAGMYAAASWLDSQNENQAVVQELVPVLQPTQVMDACEHKAQAPRPGEPRGCASEIKGN